MIPPTAHLHIYTICFIYKRGYLESANNKTIKLMVFCLSDMQFQLDLNYKGLSCFNFFFIGEKYFINVLTEPDSALKIDIILSN